MGRANKIYESNNLSSNPGTTIYFKANSSDGGRSWINNYLEDNKPNSNIIYYDPYGLKNNIVNVDYNELIENDNNTVSFQGASGGAPYALKAGSAYVKNNPDAEPTTIMLADPSISDSYFGQYSFEMCTPEDVKALADNNARVIIAGAEWSKDQLLNGKVINDLVDGGVDVVFIDTGVNGHDESMKKVYTDGIINLTSRTGEFNNTETYKGFYHLKRGGNGELCFEDIDINTYLSKNNNYKFKEFDKKSLDFLQDSNYIASNLEYINKMTMPIYNSIKSSSLMNSTHTINTGNSSIKLLSSVKNLFNVYINLALSLLKNIVIQTNNIVIIGENIEKTDKSIKEEGELINLGIRKNYTNNLDKINLTNDSIKNKDTTEEYSTIEDKDIQNEITENTKKSEKYNYNGKPKNIGHNKQPKNSMYNINKQSNFVSDLIKNQNIEKIQLNVTKDSRIVYDGGIYLMPKEYAGEKIYAKEYNDKIYFYDKKDGFILSYEKLLI